MKINKPMLAGKLTDLSKLKYPIYCTPKLDGIRCLSDGSQALSRTFKLIPNNHIQSLFKDFISDLDGELIVPSTSFNETSSAVMSEDGEPNIKYYVFDYVKDKISKPYLERMLDLKELHLPSFCIKVLPEVIHNEKELLYYEERCLALGYEGVMIRSGGSPYKEGRSSEKEGFLLKMKRFDDSEAIIVGFVEQLSNQNKQEEDNFGNSKRSSCKDGMIPANTLGAFIVKDCKTDVEFEIGTGLKQDERLEIWKNQKKYLSKIIKYKYQPYGVKDKPRLPVYLGFRDKIDIGE